MTLKKGTVIVVIIAHADRQQRVVVLGEKNLTGLLYGSIIGRMSFVSIYINNLSASVMTTAKGLLCVDATKVMKDSYDS